MVQLETLDESEIWPKFLKVTQNFCDYVFAKSNVKTLKGGYPVTGRMFGHLVQSYMETISSGKVPCLENAVVTMAKIENQAAVEEGLKLYRSEMEKVKSLFPVSLNELSAEHQKINNLASNEFMKRCFKDEEGKYFKKLMEAVDTHYDELIAQNMQASEEKCQQILADLYVEINECVQQGKYAKPGGYELYCTDRDNVFTQYHSRPNKGIQSEVVLEMFQNEKCLEAKLILQTDGQLTESEKKLREEKEQAALLAQQCKVEQEKQLEMKRLMEEEKQNQQQRLQQLERKFEEEKLHQKQELDRALDSKLTEQNELAQKGFNEKAELMALEIEQLKKEKDEQSNSVFKNIIMPLVDTAKSVFSTILDYKLMRKKLANPWVNFP